jgi:hypothetical protein
VQVSGRASSVQRVARLETGIDGITQALEEPPHTLVIVEDDSSTPESQKMTGIPLCELAQPRLPLYPPYRDAARPRRRRRLDRRST